VRRRNGRRRVQVNLNSRKTFLLPAGDPCGEKSYSHRGVLIIPVPPCGGSPRLGTGVGAVGEADPNSSGRSFWQWCGGHNGRGVPSAGLFTKLPGSPPSAPTGEIIIQPDAPPLSGRRNLERDELGVSGSLCMRTGDRGSATTRYCLRRGGPTSLRRGDGAEAGPTLGRGEHGGVDRALWLFLARNKPNWRRRLNLPGSKDRLAKPVRARSPPVPITARSGTLVRNSSRV
jgi:hypothetical protein